MRTRLVLVAVAAAALALPAGAAAKGDDAAIVIGPSGTALVEPYSTVASVMGQLAFGKAPSGPFALVYVQRQLLPRAPGRWYPRAAVYCDAYGRCVHAAQLLGSFGSGRITGLYHGAPPRLATLSRGGKSLPVASTLGFAIELAFGQAAASTARPVPVGCTTFRATWSGTGARLRPSSFCIGMNGGVYARGRQYPLYSGIAERFAR